MYADSEDYYQCPKQWGSAAEPDMACAMQFNVNHEAAYGSTALLVLIDDIMQTAEVDLAIGLRSNAIVDVCFTPPANLKLRSAATELSDHNALQFADLAFESTLHASRAGQAYAAADPALIIPCGASGAVQRRYYLRRLAAPAGAPFVNTEQARSPRFGMAVRLGSNFGWGGLSSLLGPLLPRTCFTAPVPVGGTLQTPTCRTSDRLMLPDGRQALVIEWSGSFAGDLVTLQATVPLATPAVLFAHYCYFTATLPSGAATLPLLVNGQSVATESAYATETDWYRSALGVGADLESECTTAATAAGAAAGTIVRHAWQTNPGDVVLAPANTGARATSGFTRYTLVPLSYEEYSGTCADAAGCGRPADVGIRATGVCQRSACNAAQAAPTTKGSVSIKIFPAFDEVIQVREVNDACTIPGSATLRPCPVPTYGLPNRGLRLAFSREPSQTRYVEVLVTVQRNSRARTVSCGNAGQSTLVIDGNPQTAEVLSQSGFGLPSPCTGGAAPVYNVYRLIPGNYKMSIGTSGSGSVPESSSLEIVPDKPLCGDGVWNIGSGLDDTVAEECDVAVAGCDQASCTVVAGHICLPRESGWCTTATAIGFVSSLSFGCLGGGCEYITRKAVENGGKTLPLVFHASQHAPEFELRVTATAAQIAIGPCAEQVTVQVTADGGATQNFICGVDGVMYDSAFAVADTRRLRVKVVHQWTTDTPFLMVHMKFVETKCGNGIRTIDEGCDSGGATGCVDCQVSTGYSCSGGSLTSADLCVATDAPLGYSCTGDCGVAGETMSPRTVATGPSGAYKGIELLLPTHADATTARSLSVEYRVSSGGTRGGSIILMTDQIFSIPCDTANGFDLLVTVKEAGVEKIHRLCGESIDSTTTVGAVDATAIFDSDFYGTGNCYAPACGVRRLSGAITSPWVAFGTGYRLPRLIQSDGDSVISVRLNFRSSTATLEYWRAATFRLVFTAQECGDGVQAGPEICDSPTDSYCDATCKTISPGYSFVGLGLHASDVISCFGQTCDHIIGQAYGDFLGQQQKTLVLKELASAPLNVPEYSVVTLGTKMVAILHRTLFCTGLRKVGFPCATEYDSLVDSGGLVSFHVDSEKRHLVRHSDHSQTRGAWWLLVEEMTCGDGRLDDNEECDVPDAAMCENCRIKEGHACISTVNTTSRLEQYAGAWVRGDTFTAPDPADTSSPHPDGATCIHSRTAELEKAAVSCVGLACATLSTATRPEFDICNPTIGVDALDLHLRSPAEESLTLLRVNFIFPSDTMYNKRLVAKRIGGDCETSKLWYERPTGSSFQPSSGDFVGVSGDVCADNDFVDVATATTSLPSSTWQFEWRTNGTVELRVAFKDLPPARCSQSTLPVLPPGTLATSCPATAVPGCGCTVDCASQSSIPHGRFQCSATDSSTRWNVDRRDSAPYDFASLPRCLEHSYGSPVLAPRVMQVSTQVTSKMDWNLPQYGPSIVELVRRRLDEHLGSNYDVQVGMGATLHTRATRDFEFTLLVIPYPPEPASLGPKISEKVIAEFETAIASRQGDVRNMDILVEMNVASVYVSAPSQVVQGTSESSELSGVALTFILTFSVFGVGVIAFFVWRCTHAKAVLEHVSSHASV